MDLLNLLLIPIAVVIAVLSGIVGYTPKWLKDEDTKDDDKPKKYNNIIFQKKDNISQKNTIYLQYMNQKKEQ